MADIFISYMAKDSPLAVEIARSLEAAGYSTWYYQRNGLLPGVNYPKAIRDAISRCQAMILLISPNSVTSFQVGAEITRAYEINKPIIPLRWQISDADYKQQQPEWEQMLGTRISADIPAGGVTEIMPNVLNSLSKMLIAPRPELATGPLQPTPVTPVPAPPARITVAEQSPHSAAAPTGAAKKRWLLIALIALLVLSGASGGYFIWLREPPLTTLPFEEKFNDLNRWTLPADVRGWTRTEKNKLQLTDNIRLGFVEDYWYGDCDLQFNLKLDNGMGAAWAVRVRGADKYYLFRLGGPERNPKDQLLAYAVRGASERALSGEATVTLKLKTGGSYTVITHARGYKFEVFMIDDNEPEGVRGPHDPRPGDEVRIGIFEDKDKAYRAGSVGLRAYDGKEIFTIDNFNVYPK